MNNLIAVCGINCEKCDTYVATKKDDQALREKTAALWSKYNNADIRPEHINCEGCRMDGCKTVYCIQMCEIRKCASAKSFETCADCPEMNLCPKITEISNFHPDAKKNLTDLK